MNADNTRQDDEIKSRVFVPHIPSRWNSETGNFESTVSIRAAKKYGKLVILTPPDANRMHIAPIVEAVKEKMRDYRPEDYLLAIGDPSVLALTAAIAAFRTGGQINLLKWDRQSSLYIPVRFNI